MKNTGIVDDADIADEENPKNHITHEGIASGRFTVYTRKNGYIVRDKKGNPIPKYLPQHKNAQTAAEISELQEEATREFSEK